MTINPLVHHRRSNRLKGYDYSLARAYFVTMVAWQRESMFRGIQEDKVVLSEMGKAIKACWFRRPNTFNIHLDEWVIMPNHFHGILWIQESGTGEATARTDYHESKTFPADASPQPI